MVPEPFMEPVPPQNLPQVAPYMAPLGDEFETVPYMVPQLHDPVLHVYMALLS